MIDFWHSLLILKLIWSYLVSTATFTTNADCRNQSIFDEVIPIIYQKPSVFMDFTPTQTRSPWKSEAMQKALLQQCWQIERCCSD